MAKFRSLRGGNASVNRFVLRHIHFAEQIDDHHHFGRPHLYRDIDKSRDIHSFPNS